MKNYFALDEIKEVLYAEMEKQKQYRKKYIANNGINNDVKIFDSILSELNYLFIVFDEMEVKKWR